ncbi:hypothetical protein O181_028568 [Austropuccinia psidii MF-1]|uniref:Right handed beta helix domain-containing protein n=1 Tax=Austropuccinia psidii MF-1 TaxID=1389203 RepID=A0A9Q3CRT7_9BASI|nr:hypothetical protein [Austropuccinia psidii MF-1]
MRSWRLMSTSFSPKIPIAICLLLGMVLSETENYDSEIAQPVPECLGNQVTDKEINEALLKGGQSATVLLCQGARLNLNNAIRFSAPNQSLYTVGRPLSTQRAALVVMGKNMSTAIVGACKACSGAHLGFVEIDGNRKNLGWIDPRRGGGALLEFGGDARDQTIEFVRAYDPRSWSVLHAQEGSKPNTAQSCNGMIIRNNQIGPSGISPNFGVQSAGQPNSEGATKENSPIPKSNFQSKRHAEGIYPAGQWADGISLACPNSYVYNNSVVDATDGGIVIFGAPGSQVRYNSIKVENRNMLGGINLVDFKPFNGNYKGVLVADNLLITDGAMIKVGIAMGTMVWGSKNSTSYRNYGATVRNNVFTSSNGGYFGYGIALSGFNFTNVYSNTFLPSAKFDGRLTSSCIHTPSKLPTPRNLTYDVSTTYNVKQQMTTTADTLVFLICIAPLGARDSFDFFNSSNFEDPSTNSIDAQGMNEIVLPLNDWQYTPVKKARRYL